MHPWDRLLFAAIQFSRIVSTVSNRKTATRSRPRRRCQSNQSQTPCQLLSFPVRSFYCHSAGQVICIICVSPWDRGKLLNQRWHVNGKDGLTAAQVSLFLPPHDKSRGYDAPPAQN